MRLVLSALLLAVAAPGWAEWERVEETDTQVVYIDPATIRKIGQMRRVWLMHDLKKRAPDGDMSRRTFEEHDCVGKRVRGLSGSTHTGPKLGGQTLWSGPLSSDWHYIPRGSVAATVHRIICTKRGNLTRAGPAQVMP